MSLSESAGAPSTSSDSLLRCYYNGAEKYNGHTRFYFKGTLVALAGNLLRAVFYSAEDFNTLH
jgi:hypothetical protein